MKDILIKLVFGSSVFKIKFFQYLDTIIKKIRPKLINLPKKISFIYKRLQFQLHDYSNNTSLIAQKTTF